MLRLSIITCTYNASATLARTLQSIAKQDYKEVEHIIIDGESTDNTLQMVEEYRQVNATLATGHKVIILSEKDNGLYEAMNKGIRMATGDYIVFINAGDTLPEEDTLSKVVAKANEGKDLPGVLFGDTDIVDNEGHFVRHRRLHPKEDLSWKDFRQGMIVCHQAFYAHSSIAKTTLYDPKYRFSADIDWCIRIMKKAEEEGRSLVNVHQVVVNYLAEGMTTSHYKTSLWERFRIMCHHYGVLQTILFHCWFVIRALLVR